MMDTFVVMRSYNDMPLVAQTLASLKRQDCNFKLIVFDNASTDGTRDEVSRYAEWVVDVPAGEYVPGRVLNQAMEQTTGEKVVFLNSDCVPQHDSMLTNLLSGFSDRQTAAVFGRQIPQPDCWPLYAKDTEDTFGDGRRQKYWKHCFSMAVSAIRRSVWESMPFSEDLQYSEDIDWTWRVRQNGCRIQYVSDAVVMHSHNYTWRQWYCRQYGEGKADATIYAWTAWERNWLRFVALPYGRQVLSDLRYSLKRGHAAAAFYSPLFRLLQALGRRSGFQDGWKERQ